MSIELSLKSLKPIVLQGDKGLSQKSSDAGNASYYFSQTRIDSSGTISIEGQNFEKVSFEKIKDSNKPLAAIEISN